jgi:hypothetical protein
MTTDTRTPLERLLDRYDCQDPTFRAARAVWNEFKQCCQRSDCGWYEKCYTHRQLSGACRNVSAIQLCPKLFGKDEE